MRRMKGALCIEDMVHQDSGNGMAFDEQRMLVHVMTIFF